MINKETIEEYENLLDMIDDALSQNNPFFMFFRNLDRILHHNKDIQQRSSYIFHSHT
ncbi:hypothetical protein [Aneurinibacillus migulanus]|uniref:hypothetical protein n=1 Tax=Aneurinibacillus migulanus TaxID=47500 RepID=UPI000A6E9C54|nr:hypothetical protein [Aneurinibacillus migulanus]MCP1359293.1 hypothetical protein [Aneurinibacillus migulanus]